MDTVILTNPIPWKDQFPQNEKTVKKYRPYLSYQEIDALLYFCSCNQSGTENFIKHGLESAIQTLTKIKILADAELNKHAYQTTPRKSLNERLGFENESTLPEKPDFDAMMKELNSLDFSKKE